MTADVSPPSVPSVFAQRRSAAHGEAQGFELARPGAGWRGLAAVVLPALYAWGATVAAPSVVPGAPKLARWAGVAAVLSLVTGLALSRRSPALGRAVGVLGFVGWCVVAWALLGSALDAATFDPVRAGLGSLAWGLFALGWGAPAWRGLAATEDALSPETPALVPRQSASLSRGGGFALLVGCSLSLPLLAFRVEQPGVALFAHATALAAAIAVITVGSRVLVLRLGPGVSRQQPQAMLWVCAAWLAAGLVWRLWPAAGGAWVW